MRILFTTWEGGGHVPAALIVAARLREASAQVLLVSDEATRVAADRGGVAFQPWTTAPNRVLAGDEGDPVRDWRARTPFGAVRSICEGVIAGPAGAYAADVTALIGSFRPDVIVSNELLFGVLIAGERSGVPVVLLSGNVWPFPTRKDLPPFGTAWRPAKDAAGMERDAITRRIISKFFDQGLADLNAARQAAGLGKLDRLLDQLDTAALRIVGTAGAFDYGRDPPPGYAYAGPLITVPHWAGAQETPFVRSFPDRPLVLVSFSTIFQDQTAVVGRCVRALGALPVEGVVTCGPAIDAARLPSASNVAVLRSASHDAIVPLCSAVICHGGHGTVLRPLMHGVPVLSIPSGRDQPDNATRIAVAGAGLRVGGRASSRKITRSLRRLLDEPAFRERAQAWGDTIKAEADGGRSAAEAILRIAKGEAHASTRASRSEGDSPEQLVA